MSFGTVCRDRQYLFSKHNTIENQKLSLPPTKSLRQQLPTTSSGLVNSIQHHLTCVECHQTRFLELGMKTKMISRMELTNGRTEEYLRKVFIALWNGDRNSRSVKLFVDENRVYKQSHNMTGHQTAVKG
ncbi:CLUMA_CG008752, isoform A [Clunio marinus]|uniref:CLUMA_CG008752, isoform A n=1 Tax=Clunio marinus TaxID=568069 RepID=A0A1J1I4N8_9DIPT|nr:CLUMA_CG008752, isoform A [Clunio marinus]